MKKLLIIFALMTGLMSCGSGANTATTEFGFVITADRTFHSVWA